MSPSRLQRSLHHQVVNEIGSQIVRGTIKPGEMLPNEEALCEQLGVSRTVVREAVRVLMSKGLVQPRPRVGTVVCPRRAWNLLDEDVLRWEYESGPGPDFLRNLIEVRQIIEPAAARLAALRATPEEQAAIQAAYMVLAESVDDPAAYIQADMDFHAAIFSACHNELLEQLARTISIALRASRKTTVQIPHGGRETLPMHGDVMQAILRRDTEGAFAAMSRIISRAAADIERVLSTLAQSNP